VPRAWTLERICALLSSPRQVSCTEAPWSECPNPSVWPSSCVTAAAKTEEETHAGPVVWRISTWAQLIVPYVPPRHVWDPLVPPGPPQPITPPPQNGPVVPQTDVDARSMKFVPEAPRPPSEYPMVELGWFRHSLIAARASA
jgi:hypothetical protein